jgi:hypothetical protein
LPTKIYCPSNVGLSCPIAHIVTNPPNKANGAITCATFLVGSKIIASINVKQVNGQISKSKPLLIVISLS